MTDDLMSFALSQKPEIVFKLMLGWLSQRAILTMQGENNRTRLLESSNLFNNLSIQLKDITQLSKIWMYCSYANVSTKHNIKKSINKIILKLMKDVNIKVSPVFYKNGKLKPKILVINERFKSEHAMYRCYAPMISSLKRSFEVIGMAENTEIDDNAITLFEKIYKIDFKKLNLQNIIDLIQNINPDIIYFPSIGMKPWTILISNLRLAPIQIFTQGHPATSHSDEIDYVFVNDMKGDLEKIYSERVLVGNNNYTAEGHSKLPESLPPFIRKIDEFIHIGINSKVMKLNFRIINICKRLNLESKQKLIFHFYPGERGMQYDGINAMIKTVLPNSIVSPYLDYPDFLQELKNCDILLAAFPFGNTNGTVDACLLGVPTVAHYGPENPAQSDLLVLTTAGFPKWLVNDTDEEYFNTALRLINDINLRNEISTLTNFNKVKDALITKPFIDSLQPFSCFIEYIYRNHLLIKKKNLRVIRLSDIQSEM